MDTRVLAPTGSEWLDTWPAAMVVPRAIAITLFNNGRRLDPPVLVVF
jgi:hypothetical protein